LLASLGTTLSSELLELAFTHGSYSREFGGVPTNERLEHLGDSVLELIITGELYKKFPDVDESRLSKMRAGLVNNPALVPIAKEGRPGEEFNSRKCLRSPGRSDLLRKGLRSY